MCNRPGNKKLKQWYGKTRQQIAHRSKPCCYMRNVDAAFEGIRNRLYDYIGNQTTPKPLDRTSSSEKLLDKLHAYHYICWRRVHK